MCNLTLCAESDAEPEHDRSPEHASKAPTAASSRATSPVAIDTREQSSERNGTLSKEERKQQLVERQLRYMEAADQVRAVCARGGGGMRLVWL